MKRSFEIEKETLSMSLILKEISPRDFDATEQLMCKFANFMYSYARFFNTKVDPTPDQENEFGIQLEAVLKSLPSCSLAIVNIANSMLNPV